MLTSTKKEKVEGLLGHFKVYQYLAGENILTQLTL